LDEVGAAAFVDPSAGEVVFRPEGVASPGDGEALVMFTSGTTGRPKAALIPFAGLEASLQGIARGSGLPDGGRSLVEPMRNPRPVFVPMAHMGGLLGTLTAWYLGAPPLLCPKWSADAAFDVLERFPVTVLGLTPAMVYDLATAPGERALGGVKSVGVGTAALPEATRLLFEGRYGVPILRNYGQTEFAGAIAFERYDDVVAGRRPPGSVGRLAPGVDVRIVAPDGRSLPAGEIGEIVARSGSSMRGYLADGGAPSGRSADGWIPTGDLGFVHDGDMLTIVGRTRDVIICGGFNVYPSQVEAALNRLPGVADSAVAGVTHERLGEVPVAVVVSDGSQAITLDRVRDELRATVAPYELPRRLHVVDAVPRTENGKVDRPAVAATFGVDLAGGAQ
jgi:acyl-CoA synthetase (AMP-forming)/AMP-acid ligase II